MVLYSAVTRGFSPGTSGFPLSPKTNCFQIPIRSGCRTSLKTALCGEWSFLGKYHDFLYLIYLLCLSLTFALIKKCHSCLSTSWRRLCHDGVVATDLEHVKSFGVPRFNAFSWIETVRQKCETRAAKCTSDSRVAVRSNLGNLRKSAWEEAVIDGCHEPILARLDNFCGIYGALSAGRWASESPAFRFSWNYGKANSPEGEIHLNGSKPPPGIFSRHGKITQYKPFLFKSIF